MKFNANITYKIEASSLNEASAIVTQIIASRTFSLGSAKVTGYNLNEEYGGSALLGGGDPKTASELTAETPEGADPDNDGDSIDDDVPF